MARRPHATARPMPGHAARVVAALVLLSVAPSARGEEAVAKLGLYDCLGLGLQNNLALQNAWQDTLLSRAEIDKAGASYDARLSLAAEHEDSELPSGAFPLEGDSETTTIEGGLSKTIGLGSTVGLRAAANRYKGTGFTFGPEEEGSSDPSHTFGVFLTWNQALWKNLGGVLDRARVQEARLGYEAARLTYSRVRDEVANSVLVAYWDAFAADKTYEVNKKSLAYSRELLEINREKFDDGLIDETEILAAEAALATREVEVLGTDDAALSSQDVIKELIALSRENWDRTDIVFDAATEVDTSPEEVHFLAAYDIALENRSDVAALTRAREQVLTRIRAAKQETRPDLDLSGSIGRGDTGDTWDDSFGTEKTAWSVGLRLEVPWARSAEKSALRQAEIQLRQIDNDMESLKYAIERECRVSARDLRTSIKRVAATRKARGLQARKLELEEKKLAQGRSSTRFVIEYQDDLQFAAMSHVLALSQYQKARVRYQLVQGVLLSDWGSVRVEDEP